MTIRLVVEIVSFCTGIAGFTIASRLVDRMFDEIRRSNDRRWNYSDLGHWARKDYFVVSEYRRLYPHGKLYVRWRVSLLLGVAAFAIVAVCLMT
jgi:hypothetical protein